MTPAACCLELKLQGNPLPVQRVPRRDRENTCKVLLFAATPEGTVPLALDEEVRAIEQKVRVADYRSNLKLITKWAVRPDDLIQALNEEKPQIVHFSGHGSPNEEIVLLDSDRQPKAVSKTALRALFRTLKDNIRLVMLNACYSKPQAEAIVETIDVAVGMNSAIGDKAAIVFAAAFYRALGFGRSVQDAFDQATTALLFESIPEENTPKLHVRDGIDASQLVLVSARS